MVTPKDMDHHHEVGDGDEPMWMVKRHEYIASNVSSKRPVPDQSDGEVAEGGDEVGGYGSPPHGDLGRFGLRCGDGGLDLQDDAVASVGEGYLAQCAKNIECRDGWGCVVVVAVADIVDWPSAQADHPRYGAVTVHVPR